MRKYKILIVENDEDERYFMKEGFDAAGLFQIVTELSSGDTLLQWLQAHPAELPQIILSDLNMPGKNGYDIIDDVKGHPAYAHIPVIITSTSSTQTIIDKCLAKGATDYLVKPDTFVEYEPFVKRLYQLVEDKQLVQ